MHHPFVKLVSCIGCVILIAVASRRNHVVNDLHGAIRRTLQYGDMDKEYVSGGHDNYTWWIYDQTRVCNTEWIDYYEDEIPRDTDTGGDEIDFLYDHDVCYKGGTYSHDNCLEPPDCAVQSENSLWDLKLCVNRMPIPDDDDDTYYAKVMKCIPVWENCDKCMCGRIDSSDPTRCQTQNDCDPDDDRLNLLCDEDAILRFAPYLLTPFGVCEAMPNDKEKEHIPEKFTPMLDFTISGDETADEKSEALDEGQTKDEDSDEADEDETEAENSDEADEDQTEDENSDEADEDETEDEKADETEEGQTEGEKSDETNEDQTQDDALDDATEGVATDGGKNQEDLSDNEKFVITEAAEATKAVASLAESFNNN